MLALEENEGPGGARCAPPRHHNKMSFDHASPPLTHAAPTALDEHALARLRELDPGGTNRLMERVVNAFLKSLEQHEPVLERGLQPPADLATLRHVAHTLKSAAASLGALDLSRRCAEIEGLVREDRRDGLDLLLEQALQELRGARAAMLQLLGQPR